MTDQQIPAPDLRELHRLADKILATTPDQHCSAIALANAVKESTPTPPPRTLADMTPEERAGCQWMQADVGRHECSGVILQSAGDKAVVLSPDGSRTRVSFSSVTPRPDLARLTWPGNTPAPAPAPALPDRWRLADHPEHGRVIVTTEPDIDGEVAFIAKSETWRCRWDGDTCPDNLLTYLDTAPAPNTLAVGSTWDDLGELERALNGLGRDQAVITTNDGAAYVWSEEDEWWTTGGPASNAAPFTVIYAGRED